MSTRTLPDHPNLDQLRHQAKELHRAATTRDSDALDRLAAVSKDVSLSTAQLALAREYGFPSWPRLKTEVERRRLIETGDAAGLAELLASDPALATEGMTSSIGPGLIHPLQYVGIGLLHSVWDHRQAGELTKALLAAGAPVEPAGDETWLITAASHGEPEMARVLIEAGADLEARGRAAPGSATALAHAVHYGLVDAVDLLVEAGAIVHDVVEAAGVGDLGGYSLASADPDDLLHAMRAAAVCERLDVIDRLLATGLDVNGTFTTLTEPEGATALHCAAWEGKDRSVTHLLAAGADPNRTVGRADTRPIDWARQRAGVGHGGNHAAVEAILAPVTT